MPFCSPRAALALAACALAAFTCGAQEYTFTTIAGSPGVRGTADGTNDAARFNSPSHIAVDASGALYVSDLLNHVVRKITPAGSDWVVTTIAGLPGTMGYADGTNSDARFEKPQGIQVDATGVLFVCDLTQTIRTITPVATNWVVKTIAGAPYVRGSADGTNGAVQFFSPRGLAIEAGGSLLAADSANHTIRGLTRYDTNWASTTEAGTPLAYGFADGINGVAEFNTPFGVATNLGAFYVTDAGNNAIRQITRIGTDCETKTIAGMNGIRGSDDGPASQATFYFPAGIAADRTGNLYVTDYSNQTVRKLAAGNWNVSTIGGVVLQTGTNDGTGALARFNHPWGIAVDATGNLFIADYGNHTIRKGTPSAPPVLFILVDAGSIILAWPTAAGQFTPETAPDLAPNTTWVPLSNPITVIGDYCYQTNQMQSAAAFYRLHNSGAALSH